MVDFMTNTNFHVLENEWIVLEDGSGKMEGVKPQEQAWLV
jgi:hypothetical protein